MSFPFTFLGFHDEMAFHHFLGCLYSFTLYLQVAFEKSFPPIVKCLLLVNMEASFIFLCHQLKGFLPSFGSFCDLWTSIHSLRCFLNPLHRLSLLCLTGFPSQAPHRLICFWVVIFSSQASCFLSYLSYLDEVWTSGVTLHFFRLYKVACVGKDTFV